MGVPDGVTLGVSEVLGAVLGVADGVKLGVAVRALLGTADDSLGNELDAVLGD